MPTATACSTRTSSIWAPAGGPGDSDIGDFTAWDTDRSGLVSEDEFYGGAYDVWDVDDDGMLSEAEFDAGADGEWLGDSDIGNFADWDVDDSGVLDDEEFYEGFGA